MSTFYACHFPSALLAHLANLFGLSGIPFPTLCHLNPLPREAVNQFVLRLVEVSCQVWKAQRAEAHRDDVPSQEALVERVRLESCLHVWSEQHTLNKIEFCRMWCSPNNIFSISDHDAITVPFWETEEVKTSGHVANRTPLGL